MRRVKNRTENSLFLLNDDVFWCKNQRTVQKILMKNTWNCIMSFSGVINHATSFDLEWVSNRDVIERVNAAVGEIERGGEWVQCPMPSALKQEVSTASARRCQCALSTSQVHAQTRTHQLTGSCIERVVKVQSKCYHVLWHCVLKDYGIPPEWCKTVTL